MYRRKIGRDTGSGGTGSVDAPETNGGGCKQTLSQGASSSPYSYNISYGSSVERGGGGSDDGSGRGKILLYFPVPLQHNICTNISHHQHIDYFNLIYPKKEKIAAGAKAV